MRPRFVGRLGLADGVTIANAGIGLLAVIVTPTDPELAARLILLAAIADGLDGVLARVHGHTPVGAVLDSLSDVVSFGVAPALLVFHVAVPPSGVGPSVRLVIAGCVALTFLAMAVVRLGLYTTDDVDHAYTEGVQTTLAATLLASAFLADLGGAVISLASAAILAVLMVSQVRYPDLRTRDALAMGVVQTLAVVVPLALDRAFPRALLVAACCYLCFGPRWYRRTARARASPSDAPNRSPVSSDGR